MLAGVWSVAGVLVLLELLFPNWRLFPFTPFLGAIALSAWVSGTRGGAIALVLGGLVGFNGSRDLGFPLWSGLALYLLIGLLVLSLARTQEKVEGKLRLSRLRAIETRRELEAAFHASVIGMAQSDPRTGRFVRVNGKLQEITGYSEAELLEMSVTDLVHPDDRERTSQQFADLVSGRAPEYSASRRYVRKDGTTIWVEVGVGLVRGAGGRPRLTSAFVQDVTERVESERAVRQSEERFRVLAEGLPQIVWTAGPDGELDYCSPRWEQFSGRTAECGCGPGWQPLVHPEDAERTRRAWEEAVASGTLYEVEHRIRRADGIFRWLLSRALPVRDGSGRIVKWIGSATDVHDRITHAAELQESRVRLESLAVELETSREELERRNAELARSNGDLEQFAYVVSHDLQEPLRTVASFTSLLDRKLGPDRVDPEIEELMNYVRTGVARMRALIQDLLQYSRVTRGGRPMGPTCASSCAREAVEALEAAVKTSGASVEITPLPEVVADAQQLTRLFQNLVANALKFRGADSPRVVISAAPLGRSRWQITVRDNGIGIPPQQFERIFLMFQRLHPPGEYPGTGIGLAICKTIVERHGGRIWVESEPGNGAAFHFVLTGTEETSTRAWQRSRSRSAA